MRFSLAVLLLFFSASIFSQDNYLPNQILVRFESNTNTTLFWDRVTQEQPITVKSQKLLSAYMNIWKIEYDGAVEAQDLADFIWRKQEIMVAQVNHRVASRTTPNDPFFATQWQWNKIAAEMAWDVSTGGLTANGDTIVVAIIDDGIQLDHPDLASNIWHNYGEIPENGIDDDGNGYIDDFNGWNTINGNNNVDVGLHGISVAGMVGAVGNDGNQGVGANWNVKMMTIVGGTSQEAEVLESYAYALDFRRKYNATNGAEGAFVVATNSSWGLDFATAADAPLWCAFYDSLGTHGILSCGATSNSNINVDIEGDLPSACPSEFLIMATATDNNDVRSFSGWGIEDVDIAAPGDNIYSTAFGSNYQYTSGTSLSSPLTAGVVALLYSAPCSQLAGLALTAPSGAALLVKDYLFNGVDTTAQLLAEVKTGGRVNAGKSMQLAVNSCGACLPPFGIQAAQVLDTSVNITYSSLNDGANLFFRKEGTTDWDTILNITSPYHLDGLLACQNYEIVAESICADSVSSQNEPFLFKTDGCCKNPADFQVINATDNTITLSWTDVLAADSYSVIWSSAPFTSWDSLHIANNLSTWTFAGLEDCTEYQFKIKTNCADPTLGYSLPIFATTKGCGACLDSVYCNAQSFNNNFEWISNVAVEDIFENPTSIEDDGYGLYSDLGIELTQGLGYTMIITPSYSGTEYSEYIKVWIDYDQNGQFDTDEVVINPSFTITEATSFPLDISTNSDVGLTRMRIVLSYSEITTACDTLNYGEIEDYCVTIKELEYCVGPDTLHVDDINSFSANLSWAAVDSSISYVVKYRETNGDWEGITTTSNSYQLSNLSVCTDYESQVRAVCGEGLGPKVYHNFKTTCATNISSPFGKSNFAIQPNPFSDAFEVHIQGDDDVAIRLLDVLGREIPYESTGSPEKRIIRPSVDIPTGVYLVQLRSGGYLGISQVFKL